MSVSKLLMSSLLIATLSGALTKQPTVVFPEKLRKNDFALLKESEDDKEKELRKALAEIREAIKEYKSVCGQGLVGPIDRRKDDQCYPPTLATLVEGIRPPNKKYYIQFLKRIPIDPITGKADWELRSAQDEPQAVAWGGQNVCQVFSKSEKFASDGTRYRDW